MPELALDDDQREAASHLDGVRVAKPMGCEAPAETRSGGGVAEFATCGGR